MAEAGTKSVDNASIKMVEKATGNGSDKSALIQVLLDIQRENHWLPKDALMLVSQKLDVSLTQIYHVATFYKAFSLVPRGRHIVKVCLGTACHVRGAMRIMDKMEESLGIKAAKTTQDMKFTLERVNCLGCCALGPVVVVDKDYHGKLASTKVKGVLERYD